MSRLALWGPGTNYSDFDRFSRTMAEVGVTLVARREDVPGVPTAFELAVDTYLGPIKKDFVHILAIRKSAAAVMIIVSLVVGYLIGASCAGGGAANKDKAE